MSINSTGASRVEIYVDSELKYVYNLTDLSNNTGNSPQNSKNIFVDTPIGGVNVEINGSRVRVTSSNSPKKLCVKQGWISEPGEMIIGIPDRLVITIAGDKGKSKKNKNIDFIIK